MDSGGDKKKSKKSSPTKNTALSGSGAGFKSKEYISDSSGSEGKRGDGSSDEGKKEKRKKSGRGNKSANDSFESLKNDQDEEILDSPEASGASGSGSGSEMDAD